VRVDVFEESDLKKGKKKAAGCQDKRV